MSYEANPEDVVSWDPRTPLERLKSLTVQEQRAFIAVFRARTTLFGSYCAKRGGIIPVMFGKAECEWPSFDLWRFKLPGLRLTNYSEGSRRPALGMAPGSTVWDIYIGITEDGHTARDEWWKEKNNG